MYEDMATGKWQIRLFQLPHSGLTTPQQETSLIIQGHPRSMILVPIESTYATSY